MYTEFHGLPENPFTITPNPRLAWLGASMRKVRAELCTAALEGRGLMSVCGGPGVGKSLVLALLAKDLKVSDPSCHIHARNWGPHVSATGFLRMLADDIAADGGGRVTGQLTVLLIDEAQHLSSSDLSALLRGTARYGPRLSLVLAGTPELELAVNEMPVAIAAQWSLEPLAPDEVRPYVDGRLQAAGGNGREIFTDDAIGCLTRHSGGVPRRLNVLCSTALFIAWREGRPNVDASIVEAAAFNPTGPLTDAVELPSLAPLSTSARQRFSDTSVVEVKELAVLQPAVLEVSAAYGSLGSDRSEVSELVEGRAAESEPIALQADSIDAAAHDPGTASLQEHAAGVAVTTTPLSREIAQFLEHRPGSLAIRAQPQSRRVLYAIAAGIAAIVSLLIAMDWRTRDEQSGALTSLPADQSTTVVTKQPIVVSVYVDPQFAEKGSATSGQSPPQTIGAAELAQLLAHARQQIAAFALTTPPGDNAFETLQRVLAVMPTQPDALQGIRDIATRYASLATQAAKRNERSLAKRYLDKGLRLVPDHPDLLAVQRQLAAEPTFKPGGPIETGRLRMIPNQSPGGTK